MIASSGGSETDARPIDPDPDVLVSPCDAIVGASGSVEDGQVLQIKGFPYRLRDLLGDAGARHGLPQWVLRDATPYLGHVSPIPRAA